MFDVKDRFNRIRLPRHSLMKEKYSSSTKQDQSIEFFSNI